MKLTKFFPVLIYAAVFSNARYYLGSTGGVLSFLLAGVVVVTAILTIQESAKLVAAALGRKWQTEAFTRLAILGGAVMCVFAFLETGLQVAARFQEAGERPGGLNSLAMPPEWRRRPAQIEGAKYAYYWHNIPHVHNRNSMRLVGEFPEKKPETFRIIALGDSLTYGYGIREEDTYPRRLENDLSNSFRVEVLNLGVSGAQSEDVSRILRTQFPVLHPNLVFYGVCLNDFLPSGVGQYASNRAYTVPLPYRQHFIDKTLTGNLLANRYDALLMRLGLRKDFLGDILSDFDGYQRRFAKDVRAMNAFVQDRGLPPMVAMVLDQYPDTKGKSYQVVLAAEKHLLAAGVRVIHAEYIRRNDGRKDWYVSRWEGHPNEKANAVFAQEIAEVVAGLPQLQPYRR